MIKDIEDRVDQEEQDENENSAFSEYDIISSPNDFNIMTLYSLINSGKLTIPSFQRNYVWDISKASRLIESIIIGLPVPQVFLYDDSGKYTIIDGQQRILTIYYFIKQRFPKKQKRGELRSIFDKHGRIPDEIMDDDQYFTKFLLKLSASGEEEKQLDKKNYSTINKVTGAKDAFDYRTIRCVVIKQVAPTNDKSSVFEIFNRLNSGGVNLTAQEIRMSLYHSKFMDMLLKINANEKWRTILGLVDLDVHMRDVEILLRGFAGYCSKSYSSPMKRFLNNFADCAAEYDAKTVNDLEQIFYTFCDLVIGGGSKLFEIAEGRFSAPLFESTYVVLCRKIGEKEELIPRNILSSIRNLKKDTDFIDYVRGKTTNKSNYDARLEIADRYLSEA